ncbi:MAG: glycosyltransferase [Gemmatimonadaceae bacterium]|nr:glycosyltransferase [Gemmatimonadaceae bacterium]
MRPIRACFLAQHPLSFQSVESVWRACANDPRFDAQVLAIPSVFEWGPHRASETRDHVTDYLREAGIRHTTAGRAWLDAWRPDVIFVPSPFDSQRPPEFHVESLAALARLAYVPYGFEIGGGGWQQQQFGASVHNLAWRIYARSERVRALYARYGTRRGENVSVTGHPKLDRLPALLKAAPRTPGHARTVLWNPQLDVQPGDTGWSTFLKYWKELPALVARDFPAMLLIIRPHPQMREKALGTGALTEQDWDAWIRWLSTLRNVLLDDSPEPYAVFATADALISDTSSFLLEFLPTGRPICYLRHPDGPGLNEEGAVVDHYDVANDVQGIAAFVSRVARGEDPTRSRRLEAGREYLHATDGRAGERVRDDLVRSLRPSVLAWGKAIAPAETPLVSVIIPTYRRSPILQQCLHALAQQTFPAHRFEVIVSDDGSGDDTESVVRAMQVPYALTFLTQANSGPARARNAALRHARGEIILILNDDALLEPDAVTIHVERHLVHPDGGLAVLGAFRFPERLRGSLITRIAEDTALLFHYPNMRAEQGTWEQFYTCNISMRRRDLDRIGHFDERFTGPAGEDIELGIRFCNAGGRVEYEPTCVAWHEHPQSVEGLARVGYVRGLAAPLVSLLQPTCTWSTDITPSTLQESRVALAKQESAVLQLRTTLTKIESDRFRLPDGPEGVHVLRPLQDAVRIFYLFHFMRGLLDSRRGWRRWPRPTCNAPARADSWPDRQGRLSRTRHGPRSPADEHEVQDHAPNNRHERCGVACCGAARGFRSVTPGTARIVWHPCTAMTRGRTRFPQSCARAREESLAEREDHRVARHRLRGHQLQSALTGSEREMAEPEHAEHRSRHLHRLSVVVRVSRASAAPCHDIGRHRTALRAHGLQEHSDVAGVSRVQHGRPRVVASDERLRVVHVSHGHRRVAAGGTCAAPQCVARGLVFDEGDHLDPGARRRGKHREAGRRPRIEVAITGPQRLIEEESQLRVDTTLAVLRLDVRAEGTRIVAADDESRDTVVPDLHTGDGDLAVRGDQRRKRRVSGGDG